MKPAPRRVRIIGGQWKRTPLAVADVPGLRPTPDRVRETVFNWLGQDLAGLACLDLFAGTGALGLEAASRGAARVRIVERDPRAAAGIRQAIDRLGAAAATLEQADALAALAGCSRRGELFDIVFLDPPFGQGCLPRVLAPVLAVTAPGGRLYVEHEHPLDVAAMSAMMTQGSRGLRALRAGKAGQVHYHLFATQAKPAADRTAIPSAAQENNA